MELAAAEELARTLLDQHGLGDWAFRFSRSLTRFGQCVYSTRTISLSRSLTLLNGEAVARNTVLHEIAHALAGAAAAHGPAWRARALAIGCDGKRTYGDAVAAPPRKAVGTCPGCQREIRRHRRRALFCLPCHAAGRPARLRWSPSK